MDENILYSIESFPPLPESITQLNDLCGLEDVNLKAVVAVIESDPMLYTDILHFANAPYYGFRYPITSISQAISLFGIAAIRGMSLTAAIKAHPFKDLTPYGIVIHEWFDVMEKQQRFLGLWLGKKNRMMLQTLGGLTFILEIGRLLASYALMLNNKSYQFEASEIDQLIEEEKETIGSSGDELAAKLFEFWNFETVFVDSLRYSLEPDKGIETKICATLKCTRTLFTLKGIQPFENIITLLEKYHLDSDDAMDAYEIIINEGNDE
jgi:HD-like signal output (HDOD) protein